MSNMEKLKTFLKQNAILTIATSSNDMPRSSILEYIMINDNILIATDPNSIKAKNLLQNKNVSISLGGTPIFATLDGVAETPTDEEIEEYGKITLARHPEIEEMLKKGLMSPFVFYKIVPTSAYLSDFTNGMSDPVLIEF